MKELVSIVFIYLGVALLFIASLGLFRLPDAYTRMSAVTKAITLKVALMMTGATVYFTDWGIGLKSVLIIIIIAATVPASSHLLGRQGYRSGVKKWEGTRVDEYREYVDDEENDRE